jgi:hypothetical protein
MADARAIIRGAQHGTLEEVRRLVQQDQGLLDADDGEFTPLTVASGEGCVEVLRYLLGEGGQVKTCGIPETGPPLSGYAIMEAARQCMCC